MITGNGGSVQGVGNSLSLAERGEGLRVRLRHFGGLCLMEELKCTFWIVLYYSHAQSIFLNSYEAADHIS